MKTQLRFLTRWWWHFYSVLAFCADSSAPFADCPTWYVEECSVLTPEAYDDELEGYIVLAQRELNLRALCATVKGEV